MFTGGTFQIWGCSKILWPKIGMAACTSCTEWVGQFHSARLVFGGGVSAIARADEEVTRLKEEGVGRGVLIF